MKEASHEAECAEDAEDAEEDEGELGELLHSPSRNFARFVVYPCGELTKCVECHE